MTHTGQSPLCVLGVLHGTIESTSFMGSARKRRKDDWRKLSSYFAHNPVPLERIGPAGPIICIDGQRFNLCAAYCANEGLILRKAFNPFLRKFLIPWNAMTHVHVKSLPNTYREHRRDAGIAEIRLSPMPDTLLWVPWIRQWKSCLPDNIELKESWHEVWWQ